MIELKKMCERMGFSNVGTLLASGNVVFDATKKNALTLARDLEGQLNKTFGFEVGVIVRTIADIKNMIAADPFKKVKVTEDTRLYVTLCKEEPKAEIAVPYEVSCAGGTFRILDVSGKALFSVLTLGEGFGTTAAMRILGKMLGKGVTTRNWNTIMKLASMRAH